MRYLNKSAVGWAGSAFAGCVTVGAFVSGYLLQAASAQEATAVQVDGKTVITYSNGPAPAAVPAGATPSPTPDGKGAPDGKANPGAKPGEGAKPAEGGKPAEATVITRPAGSAGTANADELKVKPDKDGLVSFNFRGQMWADVLNWLAGVSGMSLDWQEIPGDTLNLATQRPHTLAEARDLINRHLLARGFTLLELDGVLSVVNTKKLDPAMVPRVSPEELSKRSPHEFVKISFTLDWLIAETAAEELKPMLSPNGKLTALRSTNRLEAIDSVANLREIHALLQEEQSGSGQERLVREFVLKHARAAEVQEQLNVLLGIEKKGAQGPMTPQQMEMQQQMMQQQMQQAQQQGRPGPPGDKGKPQINLVVNARKNSLVANAPPDKMAIIEQAIKTLDVASEGSDSLLANVNRMQVYRLASIDPEPLVTTLNDLGMLDPTTRLQVDKRNKSIIAHASLADHAVIRTLVNKLDGTGRKFEVIQLRRLEADYVAGSIQFMMGGDDKNQTQQRRSFYYDFGSFYGGRNQEEQSTDKFRVDADVVHNRLLLWANSVELDEVLNLLGKLGEIPARGANNNTVRIIQVDPGKETDAALERIRRTWPSVAPNPLVLPKGQRRPTETPPGELPPGSPRESTPSDSSPDPSPPTRETQARPPSTGRDVTALAAVLRRAGESDPLDRSDEPADAGPTEVASESPPARTPTAAQTTTAQATAAQPADDTTNEDVADRPAQAASPVARAPAEADPAESERSKLDAFRREAPAPVSVHQGPGGEMIISSPDTNALDLFEEMMTQLAPPRKEYKVFRLKHASAFLVKLNLEEYFGDGEDKKKNDRGYRPWYYDDYGSSSTKNDSTRLSKRRPLKFIYDTDSNTIIVQGADPNQLAVIEELIKMYDSPEPADSKAMRVTTIFTLKNSKARIVAEAIKDVYRDLLSSNDKALQGADKDKGKRPERGDVYIFGGEGEEGEKQTQVKFKGKLSIGIDDLSNTLVVSTEGENLMRNVEKMIESLDQAARPALATVRVMKMGNSLDSNDVRKAIARALVQQAADKPNGQGPNGQPNGAQNPQQNGVNGGQNQGGIEPQGDFNPN